MSEERTDLIENRDRIVESPAGDLALDLVAAGIEAAAPGVAAKEALTLEGSDLSVDD